MMNPLIVLALFIILASNATAKQENIEPSCNTFSIIKSGSSSGLNTPLKTIINNNADWISIWKKIDFSGSTPPPINFIKFNLAVVSLGNKSTGGFSVEIDRIDCSDEKTQIYIKERSPNHGERLTKKQVVTLENSQPYIVIKIKKPFQKIYFITEPSNSAPP
jgi:hypothetical protein